MPRRVKKANNRRITKGFLDYRTEALRKGGFMKSKWIGFCEQVLELKLDAFLYEARKTNSKYITIKKKGYDSFKVRFSNHRPIKRREDRGDCDFFVGVTNNHVTTTEDALEAVKVHFS